MSDGNVLLNTWGQLFNQNAQCNNCSLQRSQETDNPVVIEMSVAPERNLKYVLPASTRAVSLPWILSQPTHSARARKPRRHVFVLPPKPVNSKILNQTDPEITLSPKAVDPKPKPLLELVAVSEDEWSILFPKTLMAKTCQEVGQIPIKPGICGLRVSGISQPGQCKRGLSELQVFGYGGFVFGERSG